MHDSLKRIVIIGGGSAGWITAGVIAAQHKTNGADGINITLIESATIAPIGVGEGTWPSMRATLQRIGISETEFMLSCDASFKQGSQFHGWRNGRDSYCHPFTLPTGMQQINLAGHWQPYRKKVSFADAVSPQGRVAQLGAAPKLITTKEYDYLLNYGYHLDAGKFSQFLSQHCTEKLGVKQIIDDVTQLNSHHNGDIKSVTTQTHGDIEGDLFIDCSGLNALLIGKHYQIPFIEQKQVLFNDSALAVQVPYAEDDAAIASFTHSTAQGAGWIWDIGLPSRRGIGYTYSSSHTSNDEAERVLRAYIAPAIGTAKAEQASLRKLSIRPGYREKFWHRNCVAIGMAAGFIEPLEASALAMVELSAKMISEQLPANRRVMDITAKRFNQRFNHRWQRIIDFLKLHYILTERSDSDYWIDNCERNTIPESLQELMTLWQHQLPDNYDCLHTEALFPAASFQYILYGMDFNTQVPNWHRQSQTRLAEQFFNQNATKTKQLISLLPSNRNLLSKMAEYGLSKI
ncbi:tryptophan 7-halogenase [Shewanella mesophila]|uniref:tryptophan halogenase family protein n=1 Tax=Shewanella mesophila TaxID=2864208 RepID=UPI001C65C876|nr:tryptophan halogenase family protein [Shewanella mesophila]QYJ84984.1 tryptophan 7-halogenase [Shewanella mesophila]